jgi:hypothetical protein
MAETFKKTALTAKQQRELPEHFEEMRDRISQRLRSRD